MSSQRDPRLEKRWREVIRSCARSGETIRGYCRKRGLSEASYHFWRRELSRRSEPSPKKPSIARFVPLRVMPPVGVKVRVKCPSGHLVTLTTPDAGTLAAVFAALGGKPC